MILGERSNRELVYLNYKSKFYEFNREDTTSYVEPPYDTDDLHYTAVFVISEYADARLNNSEGIEYIEDLRKVAKFYDMTLNEPRNQGFASEYWMLAMTSYFLIGNYGSAVVALSRINAPSCYGPVANLLYEMLNYVLNPKVPTRSRLSRLVDHLEGGATSSDQLLSEIESQLDYQTPESSFFSDVLKVVVKDIVEYSSRALLVSYSGISLDHWRSYLRSQRSSKLLWQAQRRLGASGVFRGCSGVVQMPTGVGKTKSVELIIRARYIRNGPELVIMIAPTVALCSEIAFNLSEALSDIATVVRGADGFISDYSRDSTRSRAEIYVVTPEKLSYLVRHDSIELCNLGLLVVDEAHLLERSGRGVRLELLLASLMRIQPDAQRILISAVTSNAHDFSKWICSGIDNVVGGDDIEKNEPQWGVVSVKARQIHVGFKQYGQRIEVPLSPRWYSKSIDIPGETGVFPDQSLTKLDLARDIALSLSNALISNGAVALYFVRRDTINKLFERLAKVRKLGVRLDALCNSFATDEADKLRFLIKMHYGESSALLEGVNFGLLPHYGNLQGSIRSVVQDELSSSRARGLVCTSTLGEGVNLPIKYLMVLGAVNQYASISVEDLANIAGRVARPGDHTDGVVFDFHSVCGGYAMLDVPQGGYSTPESSLPSALGRLLLGYFISDEVAREKFFDLLVDSIGKGFSDRALESELSRYFNILRRGTVNARDVDVQIISALSDVESFLSSAGAGLVEADLDELCHSTLAYYACGERDKERLSLLFRALRDRSETYEPLARSVSYRSQLPGATVSAMVDRLREGAAYKMLQDCDSNLVLLVDMFLEFEPSGYTKFSKEQLYGALRVWVSGGNIEEIRAVIKAASGNQKKVMPNVQKVEQLVCNVFQFRLAYFVSRLIDVGSTFGLLDRECMQKLEDLQRRIRYGVSTLREVIFCENVLDDRLVARGIADIIGPGDLASMYSDVQDRKSDISAFAVQLPQFCQRRILGWLGYGES
ncbi:DEAD/DEAH box helicase [uncultured Actinomyces sp.]|uniref:DEAD/DEAH box helicase n=1 Tax=uncultured Actinomyces sp. TaxID=249061 RepID=UPI0025FB4CA9|nr:DEAD/DEAH box helicase [uncultured Actinomyces sp.]